MKEPISDVDVVIAFHGFKKRLESLEFELTTTDKHFKVTYRQTSNFWFCKDMTELSGFIKGIEACFKLEFTKQKRVQDLITSRLTEGDSYAT